MDQEAEEKNDWGRGRAEGSNELRQKSPREGNAADHRARKRPIADSEGKGEKGSQLNFLRGDKSNPATSSAIMDPRGGFRWKRIPREQFRISISRPRKWIWWVAPERSAHRNEKHLKVTCALEPTQQSTGKIHQKVQDRGFECISALAAAQRERQAWKREGSRELSNDGRKGTRRKGKEIEGVESLLPGKNSHLRREKIDKRTLRHGRRGPYVMVGEPGLTPRGEVSLREEVSMTATKNLKGKIVICYDSPFHGEHSSASARGTSP